MWARHDYALARPISLYRVCVCVCVCVCCPQTDKSTLKYKKKAMYVLKLAAVKLDSNSIKKLVGAAGRVQG